MSNVLKTIVTQQLLDLIPDLVGKFELYEQIQISSVTASDDADLKPAKSSVDQTGVPDTDSESRLVGPRPGDRD